MGMARNSPVLYVLGAILSILQWVNGAPSGTRSYSYEFNAVAITGGGYITGIIAHPTTPNLMYTRTDIGSSYRWNQQLNKWIPLTDFISEADSNLLGTESIALDTAHPNRLYLAQGRYLTSNNSAFFVSDDQGATFDIYPAPFPMGSNELGRNNGERLAVNPFNTNELYMGTRTAGLMKSENRAQTWTNVTNFPNAAANTIGIVFVIFDPLHEGTIYVGATVPGGMYYTKNGGATWASIPGQPLTWPSSVASAFPNETAPQSTGPQPMKASLASNGVLYVTYADFPGPYAVDYGVVYKYNTKTSNWTNITPGANNSYPAPYTPQTFPAGGFCGISVDSKDPNTLVVVTLDRDPGPALDSMYLSHDGGNSWKDVSQLSTPPGSGGYWGHPISEAALDNGTEVPWLSFDWSEEWGGYGAPSPVYGLTKFGWWMTAVLMDPSNPNHVMYGTGATIWSTDTIFNVDHNQAPDWNIQAQGIEETYCLAMASPSKGVHLYSGLGDINGMRHADLDVPQPMYAQPTFSNLNSLDWAGQKQNIILRVGSSGLNDTDGCSQGAYSTDGGIGWTKFPTCIPGINATTTDSGIITIDASGKYIVWSSEESYQAVPSQTGPWSSSDFGETWVAPTGLTVQTANISADRVQPKTFYSFTSGVWYVSKDGGLSYKASNATSVGLPAGAGAVPVVNFDKAGEVWLPLGALGIYHTTNFGAKWTKIGPAGINPEFFTVGGPAPHASTPALFLWGKASTSSVTGLYRSDDNAATWVRINDDQHQYGGPTLIQGDPQVYGRVFIGTGGRGIVRADIASYNSQRNVPGTGGI